MKLTGKYTAIILVASIQLGFSQGFKTIFNGKNFDGWFLKLNSSDKSLIEKTYGINDSGWVHVMKDLPDNYNPGTTNNLLGMMFTNDKYSKYVLRWEYKWGSKIMNKDGVFKDYQWDAGVYFHNTNDGIFPAGLEYQIRYHHLQNKNHTGDLITTSVACDQYVHPTQTWRFELPEAGGKKERSNPSKGVEAYPGVPYNALNGKWNKCELIVMGNQYALFKLNGKIVNYITNLSVGEGTFGFQAESAEIFYRNIEVMVVDTVIPYSETRKDSFGITSIHKNHSRSLKNKASLLPVSIEQGKGFVQFQNHSDVYASLQLLNTNGQLIYQEKLDMGKMKKYSLKPGMYTLKVSQSNNKHTQMIRIK